MSQPVVARMLTRNISMIILGFMKKREGVMPAAIICRRCNKQIELGTMYVSKKTSRYAKKYYHAYCAERLNIV